MTDDLNDTPHQMPTDFPNDPDYFGFVGWSLAACIFVAAFVAAIWRGYRTGYKGTISAVYDVWPVRLSKMVNKKWKKTKQRKVRKIFRTDLPEWFVKFFAIKKELPEQTPNTNGDVNEIALAQFLAFFKKSLGHNLELGKKVGGQLKSLSEALEGFRTLEPHETPVSSPLQTGTMINIAVNQGAIGEIGHAVASPFSHATSSVPHSNLSVSGVVPREVIIDRDDNIWLMQSNCEGVFSSDTVLINLLKANQTELCMSIERSIEQDLIT